jgi:magnesium-transporting ATPase (P-type)
MIKQNNKSINTKNHSKTDKSGLVLGGLIVLLVAITPFLFYSYESFPKTQIWETSFFNIETSFTNWYSFAWYFTGKAIPLLLVLIWFFTCKHWWHWIILVPVAMYAFQLWGVINENDGLDSLELYYIIPLMMVLVPFVYLIRAKLFNKVRGNDLEAFERELGQNRSVMQQLGDLFR